MKLCGFLKVYNELKRGNLKRCLNNMKAYCDYIVAFDDGSTDGSRNFLEEQGCDVIGREKNDFLNERIDEYKEKAKPLDDITTLAKEEIVK